MTSVLLFFLLALSTAEDEGDVYEKAYIERCLTERAAKADWWNKRVLETEKVLRLLERRRIARNVTTATQVRGRWVFPSKEVKDEQVSAAREELQRFQASLDDVQEGTYLSEMPDRLPRVGDMGTLRDDFRVFQVMDDETAIISRSTGGEERLYYYLIGFPTKGLAAEDELRPGGIVKVSGRREIDIPLADVDSALVIEVVDTDRIRKAVAAALSAVSPPPLRTWKDVSGQFQIEARFLKVEAGQVHLERKDGKRIAVPRNRLSTEDREWIAENAER